MATRPRGFPNEYRAETGCQEADCAGQRTRGCAQYVLDFVRVIVQLIDMCY